ncbi:FeS cluster biogenesis [Beauveria brongniartii RCEF 3172]|uniref:FeS cluster biogenesis n=1 Tax=Beauveria brongniartii RCEF 3172 TaxID=1081107 RepID=A0A162KGK6_9HYPO|nr:FeS cluster biogenesis [Beauveria brongniartii RCEF 3172]
MRSQLLLGARLCPARKEALCHRGRGVHDDRLPRVSRAPDAASLATSAGQRHSSVACKTKRRTSRGADDDSKANVFRLGGSESNGRLSEIMAKDSNPNLALRIQVESGGCHGFQYLMSLITIPQKDAADSATAVGEDDSIFQYIGEDPAVGSKYDGARIILDEPSLDLLKGSKVDFTMELIGSQFKIVDNPLATSSCGCGTSFDIKM